ncbi:UNVERIFIED_CONTAM: hypothetical protein Slati_0932500 [Sesamum latifolium]|uniref:Uncharacterized protein n=1 Tax=Sesamum latifolium TaxID=2727402 RepID=A0AAW2XQN7_9LAMI
MGNGRLRPQEAKGRGAGWWMRKNDDVEPAAANTLSSPVTSLGEGNGNGKMVRQLEIYM